MPDAEETLSRLASQRADQISGQIDWFTAALQHLLAIWNAEIDRLVNGDREFLSRVAELNYLKIQIGSQLERVGYRHLAQQFLAFYSDAELSAAQQIHALGIVPNRLAPLNQDALRTLREIDLGRILRLGETVVATVSEGIVLNALGGLTRRDMIESVATALGGMSRHAVAIADTGLVSYDRYVHWNACSDLTTNLKYIGPNDIKIRPWCKEHIDKVYSKDEILGMDNGNLNPPWRFGGGWSCRHVWIPFVK